MKTAIQKFEKEIASLKGVPAKFEPNGMPISLIQKQAEINVKICKEREIRLQRECDEIRDKLINTNKFVDEVKQTLPGLFTQFTDDIAKMQINYGKLQSILLINIIFAETLLDEISELRSNDSKMHYEFEGLQDEYKWMCAKIQKFTDMTINKPSPIISRANELEKECSTAAPIGNKKHIKNGRKFNSIGLLLPRVSLNTSLGIFIQ